MSCWQELLWLQPKEPMEQHLNSDYSSRKDLPKNRSNVIDERSGVGKGEVIMNKIRMICSSMILCFLFSTTVHAKEITPEKATMDIVFVIDSSGSMKKNDPSRIGLSMVQAFIDTAPAENVRVGYVAYNENIVSCAPPESISAQGKRELLKEEIGGITYSGDTDIGLGISCAYDLLPHEKNSRQIIVLISDGETDLSPGSQRTEEQSVMELEQCVEKCRADCVQIYTVAFGQYEGSPEKLEKIAEETGAENYTANGPEELIKVLYGILQGNSAYKIQQFSNGTYAGGSQEIKCVLNAPYVDEVDILLLSSKPVGETVVRYGSTELELTDLSHYAVAKIENLNVGAADRELVIRSQTGEQQDLQVYIVSYRKLMPVLQIDADTERNRELKYCVYFKTQDGSMISDSDFYKTLSWNLTSDDTSIIFDNAVVSEGILKGKIRFSHSGTYMISGVLSDEFGSFSLPVQVEVTNTMPTGDIPDDKCTLLDGKWTLCLDDYFTDQDNDTLTYRITGVQEGIDVQLEKNLMTVTPKGVGTYAVTIQVSDGENAVQYVHRIQVIPLWRAYWWVLVLIAAAAMLLLWRILHKPTPELERLTEEKKQNRFSGKLDAYFVLQPEGEEEIPPLSFLMSRVKDSRISLGALFGNYPEQSKALQLDDIFLIADENHSMTLYHRSRSGVMVGNAIACMQIQYSVSIGDIIYITSPEGDYDLEIHYVAVFQ